MENKTYDYGCLMINFKIAGWDKIIKKLAHPYDIYVGDGEYGYETEPHTTLLYGFHDKDLDYRSLKPYLTELEKIKIKTNKISSFKNEQYDVLKFDIDSDILHSINNVLTKKFPFTTDFPKYNPHCTIAYLKPGTSDKYIRQLSKPYYLTPDSYKFSYSNGDKIFFKV